MQCSNCIRPPRRSTANKFMKFRSHLPFLIEHFHKHYLMADFLFNYLDVLCSTVASSWLTGIQLTILTASSVSKGEEQEGDVVIFDVLTFILTFQVYPLASFCLQIQLGVKSKIVGWQWAFSQLTWRRWLWQFILGWITYKQRLYWWIVTIQLVKLN